MSAHWIWNGDEAGYDDYREARHEFTLTDEQFGALRKGRRVELAITADALYQVWINGQMLGHGPAKSAKGTRGVDLYDLAGQVGPGNNRLDVLVLNLGAGNMCYCPAKPGLRFEVRLDGDVVAASGPATLMRSVRSRQRPTVRRWMLPCIEDVDGSHRAGRAAGLTRDDRQDYGIDPDHAPPTRHCTIASRLRARRRRRRAGLPVCHQRR